MVLVFRQSFENCSILKQLFSSVPVIVHRGEQFLLAVNNAVINGIQRNLSCILPHSTVTYIIAVLTELVSINVFDFLNSQSTRSVWRTEESLCIKNMDHTGEKLNSF